MRLTHLGPLAVAVAAGPSPTDAAYAASEAARSDAAIGDRSPWRSARAMGSKVVVSAGVAMIFGCSGSPVDAGDAAVGAIDAPRPEPCASTAPWVSRAHFTIGHPGRLAFPSSLSSDELTVYCDVGTLFPPVVPPDSDVYVATRADRDQPFADHSAVTALRTPRPESGAVESADGRELIFAREDIPGDRIRLYHAKRSGRDQPFATGTPLLLDGITLDASLSADGAELFYVFKSSYTTSFPEIHHAVRAGDTFSVGTPVLRSATADEFSSPVISADGLTLYFRRYPVASAFVGIWYLRRPLVGGPWSGPHGLPDNRGAFETGRRSPSA